MMEKNDQPTRQLIKNNFDGFLSETFNLYMRKVVMKAKEKAFQIEDLYEQPTSMNADNLGKSFTDYYKVCIERSPSRTIRSIVYSWVILTLIRSYLIFQ